MCAYCLSTIWQNPSPLPSFAASPPPPPSSPPPFIFVFHPLLTNGLLTHCNSFPIVFLSPSGFPAPPPFTKKDNLFYVRGDSAARFSDLSYSTIRSLHSRLSLTAQFASQLCLTSTVCTLGSLLWHSLHLSSVLRP